MSICKTRFKLDPAGYACRLHGKQPGGRFINNRIASFATFKSLIASASANAVSSKCDRYFRVAKIANRCLEAVLAFHHKSQEHLLYLRST